jgi:hypothetical protein
MATQIVFALSSSTVGFGGVAVDDTVSGGSSLVTIHRLVSSSPVGGVTESQIQDGVSGGVLSLAASLAADRTATFPDASLTVAGQNYANVFTAAQTIRHASGLTVLQAATQDAVALVGRAGGTSSYVATITPAALTASRTITLPDADSNTVRPSSASAHQFATGISSAGVISYAQPAYADISGLASMAQQSASAVAITGGAIDGTVIGGSSAAAGTFTTLAAASLALSGVGSSGTLAASVGTSLTASNRVGWYSDLTASAESLNAVIGGVAGVTQKVSSGVVFVGYGTTNPQRLVHYSISANDGRTIVAQENTDTTDANGVVTSFRTATTGAGAASFQELAAMQVLFTTHDHATRAATIAWYTSGGGAATQRLKINATGGIEVASLTSGRVTYAGTSGLLSDDSGFTRTAGSTLTVDAAADNIYTFGSAKFGFPSGGTTGNAYYGRTGMTTGNYALRQDTSYSTLINAVSGQTIKFRINNGTDVLAISSTTLTVTDAINLAVGSTSGTKIGTATSQKLGFFNATPVVQPSGTGTSTGFTAGSGTAVQDVSTFTGGTGSTAYRISDIVLALKNLGLLAA